MRQHRARAVGQIAFAVVGWSSCLPVVSACDDDDDSCNSSRSTMIGVMVAGVVLVLFLLICGVCLRRRRLQKRMLRLSHVPHDEMARGWSSNPPKPYNVPVPGGYHTYHEVTSPAPPPLHAPQYPPRGYDTYHRHSRSQSIACAIPEPTSPVSSVSMRAPSSTISKPTSSLDTTLLSLRSSVRKDEPTTIMPSPSSSPSSALPHSTQTNVAESPLPSLPSSPPPRSPSVAPASSPRPSGTTPLPNAARPSALAPLHTGTSNNVEEPPPAYTPL